MLWCLDDFVQEMTVLNTFFIIKNRYGVDELVTPDDNGCILPGTIRNSIIELAPQIEADTGLKVCERAVSIHELIGAAREERLVEAFGASTPSFIQPISKIVYRASTVDLSGSKFEYVNYLNSLLMDIMTGPVSHPWVFTMSEEQ